MTLHDFVLSELISAFDGGSRQVIGDNATAGIFLTLPTSTISRLTAFFDVVTKPTLIIPLFYFSLF